MNEDEKWDKINADKRREIGIGQASNQAHKELISKNKDIIQNGEDYETLVKFFYKTNKLIRKGIIKEEDEKFQKKVDTFVEEPKKEDIDDDIYS